MTFPRKIQMFGMERKHCLHLSEMTDNYLSTVYAVIVSAPLEGEVARSAKGGSANNIAKNNGLLRRFAPRNDR